MALVVFLSANVHVFAHNENRNTDESLPTPGVTPNDGYRSDPGGNLSQKEIRQILNEVHREHKELKEIKASKNTDFAPQHFSLTFHLHNFTGIYQRYDGFIDRGVVAGGTNTKSTPDTLQFAIQRTVSNGWTTNIGFSDGMVSANVGYNVNWSESRTFSYAATVAPFTTVYINYQDWYHVQLFNVRTDWVFPSNTFPAPVMSEYGSGWAKQWFRPHFVSWTN